MVRRCPASSRVGISYNCTWVLIDLIHNTTVERESAARGTETAATITMMAMVGDGC